MIITPNLLEAFLKCPTKCSLRVINEPPGGNSYAEWVKAQNESYRNEGARRLLENFPENERVIAPPASENPRTAKWRLAVDLVAQSRQVAADSGGASSASPASSWPRVTPLSDTDAGPRSAQSEPFLLESRLHAVERVPAEGRGRAAQFIPIRFIFRNKLTKDDKLLLAFDAVVLSAALGRDLAVGKIIHGDDHATLKVKTSALAGEVRKRLEKIAALLSSPAPPDLVLNRHCAECEFQSRCRQRALETDDLSLLAGMSAKERQKLRSKGIFTVTQLSYTFRPRRRPKRLRGKREKYHHSLKALAIREKKIHIVGSPELKIEGTPVYLDVEGLPDRDFYYLIGVRIGNGESAVQHSLWADTVEDEGKIWREFLGILETVEKPVLLHYGSYETTFARIMRHRHGSPRAASTGATAVDAMVNVLSFVFAQVYFPTHSNSMKDLAGWLRFAWPDPALFGPNSIRCRFEWQRSRETAIRKSLTAYNVADCGALCFLCQHLTALSSARSPNPQRARMDLVNVDQIKPLPRFRLMSRDGAALPAFKAINKAAYWDYQRTRVYVRTSKIIKKACRQNPEVRPKLPVRRTVRYPAPCSCSYCGGNDLFRGRATNLLVHDIRFMRSGAKGWLTRAMRDNWFCRNCRCLVRPPGIGAFAVRKFGPHLRAYAMYQLIQLRISGITVAESLSHLFHFDLNGSHISAFKSDFAGLYTKTVQELTTRITRGFLVHADETKVRLIGKSGFVWVFASLEDVVFLYSDTREGGMVQELLKDFHGVLVSDFYAAYDAINCPQQKCLIHLMRDINDDLYRYPYDEDLRGIGSEYGDLIRSIVETVDKHGLKRRFLARHQPEVEKFFRRLWTEKFESEAAQSYQKRFQKNRGKLFTFLTHDGVSWNNNNAENAIRAFAELRRVIGGTCTEKGLREYLVLLSICETCKRRGINFLDFILSEETKIEELATGRSSHSMATPDKERQRTKAKPKVPRRGSIAQKSEFRVPEQVSLERRDDCHPVEIVNEGGVCSREEDVYSDAQNTEVVRLLNDQCMVKTQDGHRVVIVSGIVLAEYALGDRVGEAHAMVSLVEQGLADQNDVAQAFGCSARTVRRYQRRFEDGGLAALGHGRGNRRKRRGRLANPRRQLVQHLKTQGCSDPEIARRIGVSEKAVRNLLRRLG